MDFVEIIGNTLKKHQLLVEHQPVSASYSLRHTNVPATPYDSRFNFLNDLEVDLGLEKSKKKLLFNFKNNLESFKQYSVWNFINLNPPIEEFDNVFHSFYRHYPIEDIFSIVSDYRVQNRPKHNAKKGLNPYIMYLLKQDFTHQNFTHTAFAKSLGFNMVVHDDHYPEFKEVLYSFIDRHYKHVIDWDVDPATFSANDEGLNDRGIRDYKYGNFQSLMLNAVSKIIKEEDLNQFLKFWPDLMIDKSHVKDMLTSIDNCSIFNLNYSYLAHKFPHIRNTSDAVEAAQAIQECVEQHFKDYFSASIIANANNSATFAVVFKNNLIQDDLPQIFDSIISTAIDFKVICSDSDSINFVDYAHSLGLLTKQIDSVLLDKTIGRKETYEHKGFSAKKI